MQKRTILKYENEIRLLKNEYLANRRKNAYEGLVDSGIFSILYFSLLIKDYKAALKNLLWLDKYTPDCNLANHFYLEAALVQFKNNYFKLARNLMNYLFLNSPYYKDVFTTRKLGLQNKDGSGLSYSNPEWDIDLGRLSLREKDYDDFKEWVRKEFNIDFGDTFLPPEESRIRQSYQP